MGIVCCLLIYLFVQHEWSYDTFHEKSVRSSKSRKHSINPYQNVCYYYKYDCFFNYIIPISIISHFFHDMKYHYQNQLFLLLYITILIPSLFLACHSENNSSASISINDGFVTGAEGAELYYQVMGDSLDTLMVVHGGPGAGMR